jgi:hypothetical protein
MVAICPLFSLEIRWRWERERSVQRIANDRFFFGFETHAKQLDHFRFVHVREQLGRKTPNFP